MPDRLSFVFLGLTITSSWGNGHATTYRGLVRELAARGHDVLFLERDMPWYAENRDLPEPPYGRTRLYGSLDELQAVWSDSVRRADVVIVGSYVPEGIAVGDWALHETAGTTFFYDIDTPVTLASLEDGTCPYVAARQIRTYDAYLSFSGGPTLARLQSEFGSPAARALYCSFDPALYFPDEQDVVWDLGYLGTYSDDRQPVLDSLLLEPARRWTAGRFVVAGPQFPGSIAWPQNVDRRTHVAPPDHRAFYNQQRFTLNVTRRDMVRAGWSPSVRLFEAAACGVPMISDWWEGLDSFFTPDREIFVSRSPEETLALLQRMPDADRREAGARARDRVLAEHTGAHRAEQLEGYVVEARQRRAPVHLGVAAATRRPREHADGAGSPPHRH